MPKIINNPSVDWNSECDPLEDIRRAVEMMFSAPHWANIKPIQPDIKDITKEVNEINQIKTTAVDVQKDGLIVSSFNNQFNR